jgi:hypothetical protein
MISNITIRSNLMIDDDEHKPEYRYLPGDFVGVVYPGMIDVRVIERDLTPQQIVELKQYLICSVCHRMCAGTCSR